MLMARDGPSFEVVMSIHRDTVVSLFIFMLVCNRRVILKHKFNILKTQDSKKYVGCELTSVFSEIWQECCPIMWQKTSVGEYLFVASFKSNEYLRKGTARFIKS